MSVTLYQTAKCHIPVTFMYYEGRSEINASYFIMLAHDVGGECC